MFLSLGIACCAVACGARSSLLEADADAPAGGGGCESNGLVPRSIAIPETMPGWAEIDGMSFRANGLLIWGAGYPPTCGTTKTFGQGTHFIGLLSWTGDLLWERRFAAGGAKAVQVTAARDGGSYALIDDEDGAFVSGLPPGGGLALVHFDADGGVEAASPVQHVGMSPDLCSSELTGMIVVAGACYAPFDPGCASMGSGRLVWFDPDLTQVAVDELASGDAGISSQGACAFDGEDLLFTGSGHGSFTFGSTTVDLGTGNTLVARITPDHGLAAWITLDGGDLFEYAIAVDPASHDVIVIHEHGSANPRMTRLTAALSTEWSEPFDGKFVDVGPLRVNRSGEAVFSVFHHGPLTFAGHLFGSSDAVAAVDAMGHVTWALEESAAVLATLEDSAGNHYLGGWYDASAPPEHGGPWPTAKGTHGLFMGIPAD